MGNHVTQLPERSLSVAFVTARFPPMDSTGTIRVSALRRDLTRYGIEPIFVTISPDWMKQQDASLRSEDIAAEPDSINVDSSFGRVMRAWARIPLLRRLQRWLAVPDILIDWARATSHMSLERLDEVDAVYVTAPPYSALGAGRNLSRRLEVPLLIELRDPIRLDRRASKRGRFFMARLRRYERQQLLAADAIVTVTAGVKRHILDSHPEISPELVTVIPNGAGSALQLAERERMPRTGKFTVVYVGSLRGRDDVALLRQLASDLGRLNPPGILRLVGHFSDDLLAEITSGSPGAGVVATGRLSRAEAIKELERADVSLVIAGVEEHWWIGRKAIESLVHARQILAIAPSGDLAEVLSHSAKSIVVPRNGDPEQLEMALSALEERSRRNRIPQGQEPFVPTDEAVASSIAQLVRAVVDGGPIDDWSWHASR